MKDRQENGQDIFENRVREHFRESYGDEVQVSIHDVRKNNGVVLRGLTVMNPQKQAMPTLYLEDYYREYERGVPVLTLLDEMEKTYRDYERTEELDVTYFADYNKVRCTLVVKLINYEENESYLENVPYYRWLDLAVICQSRVLKKPKMNAVVTIQNHHLESWGIDKEQLFMSAMENSSVQDACSIMTMDDVFGQVGCDEETDCEEYMHDLYVLSNTSRINGAVALLYPGILEKCAGRMGEDYFIIPSSIHEVLMLAENEERTQELLELVRSVNDEHVCVEERLSYHVYRHYIGEGIVRDMVTGRTVMVM